MDNRIITKTYHFILFGPLALCNANDEIAVSFATAASWFGKARYWWLRKTMRTILSLLLPSTLPIVKRSLMLLSHPMGRDTIPTVSKAWALEACTQACGTRYQPRKSGVLREGNTASPQQGDVYQPLLWTWRGYFRQIQSDWPFDRVKVSRYLCCSHVGSIWEYEHLCHNYSNVIIWLWKYCFSI